MNNSIMMGRLVRDPEINYVENKDGDEIAVANFRLAVDRKFSDDTDFFPCAAFGQLAEFAEKYLFQGIKVVVRGSMENNNYTNRDGDKVYGVRLRLDDIEFAESKKARGNEEEDDDGGSRRNNSGSRRRSSGSRGNAGNSRSSRSSSGRNSGYSSGRNNTRNNSSSSRNSRSSNRQVDEEFEGMDDNYNFD